MVEPFLIARYVINDVNKQLSDTTIVGTGQNINTIEINDNNPVDKSNIIFLFIFYYSFKF